jgi:hypothetical protein
MEVDDDALAQLDGLLEWMGSKIRSTKKVCSWLLVRYNDFTLEPEPRASSTLVSDIQITTRQPLSLKDDMAQRVDAARLAGTDHFMSSRNMHQFLDMLLRLVARPVRTNQPFLLRLHSQFK